MEEQLYFLFDDYKRNPTKVINKFIDYTTKTNNANGYLICGVHYMLHEIDDIKAYNYLSTGLRYTYDEETKNILYYTLGYLCEQVFRSGRKFNHPNYRGLQSVISFYDLCKGNNVSKETNKRQNQLKLDYPQHFRKASIIVGR